MKSDNEARTINEYSRKASAHHLAECQLHQLATKGRIDTEELDTS